MVDIKNIFKKFEAERSKKLEEIKNAEKEILEAGFDIAREKKLEIGRRIEGTEADAGESGAEAPDGFTIQQGVNPKTKEQEKKIEGILAKGVEEAYLNMDSLKQMEFKREGEKTAREINSLLEKTKVKVKKIISLIKKWLSLIPGVNKFFLEQESKIKADEILKIRK